MKTLFTCEKCGRNFKSEQKCKEHEEYCQKPFPIKGIFVNWYEDENGIEKLKFDICEYNNAVLCDEETINLVPRSRYIEPIEISKLFLDQVHKREDGDTGIYTANFSEEYEIECIDKIIEEEKECYKIHLKNYIKRIENNIKTLEDKDYTKNTYKYCTQVRFE